MSFVKLRNVPFIAVFLKVFIMNGCWIFVKFIVLLVCVGWGGGGLNQDLVYAKSIPYHWTTPLWAVKCCCFWY